MMQFFDVGLVVKLADTQDLGSCVARREGSTPSGPTISVKCWRLACGGLCGIGFIGFACGVGGE